MKIGILTVSDTCSSGDAEDKSGRNLRLLIENGFIEHGKVLFYAILPDDAEQIKAKLLEWVDHHSLDLILTTGGTGCSPRDVTPEATNAVLEKQLPGMVIAMITKSLQITNMAMLSRPACGIRKKTLIVNLPGSQKAAQECLEIIHPAIRHAVDLIQDRSQNVLVIHSQLQTRRSSSADRVLLAEAEAHHSRTDMHVPHLIYGSHEKHSSHQHSGVQSTDDSGSDHSHDHGQHHGNQHHRHHHHHHQIRSPPKNSSMECEASVVSTVDEAHIARRPRESPFPAISVEEALKIVMSETFLCGIETISYRDGLNRTLAEDVFAAEPLPPFPASIKDGYAVLASDGAGKRLVVGDSTAGSMPSKEVTSGWCMRISTGAPLPPGADAVVQVEDTALLQEADDGNEELEINILVKPDPGQEIRNIGSDIAKGEKILAAGTKLGPSEVGLLASIGITQIICYKQPKVGVMSTGNELQEPEEPQAPGKIRDSNRAMLIAALREQNIVPVDLGIAKDTANSLLSQIIAALQKVDVIVTSGGVSMGEKDLVKNVLTDDLGAKIHFARVTMKPGKPTTFATFSFGGQKKLFFGLPGNPVSAIVTCNLYVVPAIYRMSADPNTAQTKIKARINSDIHVDPRPEYHRCRLNWNTPDGIPVAESTGNQISSRLLSMKAANALLLLPPRTQDFHVLTKEQIVDCLIIGKV